MTALAIFVGAFWIGVCIDNGLLEIARAIKKEKQP